MSVVKPVEPYKVKVIDCRRPQSINQFSYLDLCQKKEVDRPETKPYYLLQMPSTRIVKGHSCFIRRSTFTMSCGVWAHIKLLMIPEIEVVEPMAPLACQSLINNKAFRVPGGRSYHVKLNQETIIAADTVGVLQEKDGQARCQGQQTRINGDLLLCTYLK